MKPQSGQTMRSRLSPSGTVRTLGPRAAGPSDMASTEGGRRAPPLRQAAPQTRRSSSRPRTSGLRGAWRGKRSPAPPRRRLAVTRRAGSIGAAGPATITTGGATLGPNGAKPDPGKICTVACSCEPIANSITGVLAAARQGPPTWLAAAERRHSRQLAALEPFEEGAAGSRDITEIVDHTGLGEC